MSEIDVAWVEPQAKPNTRAAAIAWSVGFHCVLPNLRKRKIVAWVEPQAKPNTRAAAIVWSVGFHCVLPKLRKIEEFAR